MTAFVFEPVSTNKLKSALLSALFACANEATVRDKCIIKKFTKGLSCFSFNKPGFFCVRYFLKTKHKPAKTIMVHCFSCQKQVHLWKISSIMQELKIGPKSGTPFLHKGLQLFHSNVFCIFSTKACSCPEMSQSPHAESDQLWWTTPRWDARNFLIVRANQSHVNLYL